MTHVIVNHRVNDYETWKQVFDDFVDTRRSFGEKSYQIFHQADDPNRLLLVFGWDSVENARKFMTSPELKSAMKKGGVTEEPTISFMEESARGTL